MNRIRETRPAPRYGLLWAFVRRMLLLYAAWAVCRVIFYLMNASAIGQFQIRVPHLLDLFQSTGYIRIKFLA